MLDIIFSNIVYEVAVVYGFSGLSTILTSSTSTTLTSSLDSIRDTVESKIREIADSYNLN